MRKIGIVRQIDELGRVVLPIEVRRTMVWGEKSPVDIYVDEEEGEVILKSHQLSCVFCGETEGIQEFKKKHLCEECQKSLAKLCE